MNAYQADLHIHTALSPCAEVEMIPSLIVAAAQMVGLDLIAIADHNSCENAGAVMQAADGTGLKVLPGLEVQSVEGVHLLCLFDELDQALVLQKRVYETLIRPEAAEKYFEQQMVLDSGDEFMRYCEEPIALPTTMDIDEVYERVMDLSGILIPSHIDRTSTGLCGVLGMVPEFPHFEGVEISANITRDEAGMQYPSIGDRAIFQSSDAHWLSAIGERRTTLYIERRSVVEIKKACRGEDGRRVGDA